MKNSTLILMLCASLASCTKEAVLPSASSQPSNAVISDNETISSSLTFEQALPNTIYLTKGLNTLQSGNFSISGQTSYIVKFIFTVTDNPVLSSFKFYVDGAQFPATISYSEGAITVAAKRGVALQPGDHSFILQAKTIGTSGSSFSIALTEADIVNRQRLAISVFNLPVQGNYFTLN